MIAHTECLAECSLLATEWLRSASWVEDFTSFLVVFTTLYWLSKVISKYFKGNFYNSNVSLISNIQSPNLTAGEFSNSIPSWGTRCWRVGPVRTSWKIYMYGKTFKFLSFGEIFSNFNNHFLNLLQKVTFGALNRISLYRPSLIDISPSFPVAVWVETRVSLFSKIW